MTTPTHGRGFPLDAHMNDTAAHSAAGLQAAADLAGPEIIAPPYSLVSAPALGTWYVANYATFMRFHVPVRKAYRYINYYQGASSGNIQVGVSSLARSGTTVNATRVMSSGVIACPTANTPARIDCGATTLAPGDYVAFLWCDNTTASFMHSLVTGLTANRMLFAQDVGGSGVGTGVLTLSVSTRYVGGLTLESTS